MTEDEEPGGVICISPPVLPVGEVGVQPPAQALVEALGPIDVGNREDHDLDLLIDRRRKPGGVFIDRLRAAHRDLRDVGGERRMRAPRTAVHQTLVSVAAHERCRPREHRLH
jgi:hypothetical protein